MAAVAPIAPVARLLSRLAGVSASGSGWSARCPAHDDQHASLSVAVSDTGLTLVKCHAGCSAEAIVQAVGLSLADLFPEKSRSVPPVAAPPKSLGQAFATTREAVATLQRQFGPCSAVWVYQDAAGSPVGAVLRWDKPEGKLIRPVSRYPDGWRIAAMPEPRPLYRLPEVQMAQRVLVVEGEKCVMAARTLGFVATTSAGGALAAHKTDWSPLKGKDVWILPDNDEPGRTYAEAVAGLLAKLKPAPTVRIVALPGLSEHGDLVDWIENHGDAAEPDSLREELEALGQACTREEQTLPADDLAFRPFPVAALPEPLQGFVDAGARAIGCDPSYLALPLLAVCASAIGNTRRLQLKRGWRVPPIIWGAIVGESGTAKTPAFQLALRPVRELQRLALERYTTAWKDHEADLVRWERDLATWKRETDGLGDPPARPQPPSAQRFLVSDTTVEALATVLQDNPRGVLLARDELAGWIGSFDRYAKSKSSTDAANWLSMFNAESLIVDRKTGPARTLHVAQAAVCVVGGIQPGILRRALGQEHRESGLAARLLLACPPRQVKRWTDADIDPSVEASVAKLFARLQELQPTRDDDGQLRPAVVQLSAEAKAAWTAYYNAHAEEQVDLVDDLAAAWSKLEEYAARLALVVHCIRWATGEVAEEHVLDAASMQGGITLAEWFKHEAKRVYALLNESNKDCNIRRLVQWIERRGGTATTREVQRNCWWLREPGKAEQALEELVQTGWGRWMEERSPTRGALPRRVFVVASVECRESSVEDPVSSVECRVSRVECRGTSDGS